MQNTTSITNFIERNKPTHVENNTKRYKRKKENWSRSLERVCILYLQVKAVCQLRERGDKNSQLMIVRIV